MKSLLTRLFLFFRQKSGTALALLITATLVLGIPYSFYQGNQLRYLPDEQDYFTLSTNIIERGSFTLDGTTPSAYRAPGYPLFLAVFRFWGAPVVFLRMLNFLLLGGCVLLLYLILREQDARTGAILGALFAAAYPLFFYTAGTIYPQTLASLLFLLAIFFFTRKRMGLRDYFWGGLSMGCLILTVPTFLFVLFVFAGWLWLRPQPRKVTGLLLMGAAAISLIGLWTVRNYSEFGSFVFVSTNSGENLLLGNSENTTPNGGANVDISKYTAQTSGMDEAARDRFYQSQAIEYIRTHKLQSIQRYFQKVLNYFNFRNELVTQAEASPWKDLLMLATYGPLLLCCAARLILMKRFKITPFEILLVALYGLNAVISAVFFTRIRFREPFDFLLVLIAALFFEKIIHAWLFQSEDIHYQATYDILK